MALLVSCANSREIHDGVTMRIPSEGLSSLLSVHIVHIVHIYPQYVYLLSDGWMSQRLRHTMQRLLLRLVIVSRCASLIQEQDNPSFSSIPALAASGWPSLAH